MTDHGLILLLFCEFLAEDLVARSLQRIDSVDLSNDVNHRLIVHLRRLEHCIDDSFIREDDVAGQ